MFVHSKNHNQGSFRFVFSILSLATTPLKYSQHSHNSTSAHRNLPAYAILIKADIICPGSRRDGHVSFDNTQSAYQTYVPNGATNKPYIAKTPRGVRKLFLNTACTHNGGGAFLLPGRVDFLLTSFQWYWSSVRFVWLLCEQNMVVHSRQIVAADNINGMSLIA